MWLEMSKQCFQGQEVDLLQMLAAREKRAGNQYNFLEKHPNCVLLSATMIIPGPIKTNKQLRNIFLTVITEINDLFPPKLQAARKYCDLVTGPEYYLVFKTTPKDLKKQMIQLEENHLFGRLVDLDVLYMDKNQLRTISRTELNHQPRGCFICENDAKICGRQRRHSIEEMQEKITQLIEKGRVT